MMKSSVGSSGVPLLLITASIVSVSMILRGSPSASVSLTRTSISTGVSGVVSAVSSVATGGVLFNKKMLPLAIKSKPPGLSPVLVGKSVRPTKSLASVTSAGKIA